jgi:biopolymer transport protein ExbD
MADQSFVNMAGQAVLEERRRRKRSGSTEISLNMTAMIDVLFMLMLFFLIGTRFAPREGALESKMPDVSKGGGPPVAGVPINIAIDEELNAAEPMGTPVILVGQAPAQTRVAMDSLYGFLKDLKRNRNYDETTKVYIKPAAYVSWNHVARVYNTVLRLGFQDVNWSAAGLFSTPGGS